MYSSIKYCKTHKDYDLSFLVHDNNNYLLVCQEGKKIIRRGRGEGETPASALLEYEVATCLDVITSRSTIAT